MVYESGIGQHWNAGVSLCSLSTANDTVAMKKFSQYDSTSLSAIVFVCSYVGKPLLSLRVDSASTSTTDLVALGYPFSSVATGSR